MPPLSYSLDLILSPTVPALVTPGIDPFVTFPRLTKTVTLYQARGSALGVGQSNPFFGTT